MQDKTAGKKATLIEIGGDAKNINIGTSTWKQLKSLKEFKRLRTKATEFKRKNLILAQEKTENLKEIAQLKERIIELKKRKRVYCSFLWSCGLLVGVLLYIILTSMHQQNKLYEILGESARKKHIELNQEKANLFAQEGIYSY